ncbi:phosphoribosylaminoimidazole-succinocarboxamide synthase [Alkalihalobacillus alcalophilus ATCC 27647 = CGMCC 1.3604]|uniref:Phosphoribosylaminoimidazole-succinocarboxamide synthase n=1 Tax=Alkalihalobacillus alcalophilus ATCC 27647 = CGMCC 1.3604 TaxID=1218173 RepID=A0A094WJA2_ALKAL|nr:phosphoribosylaminoimidazolesuccinocarboxamide synthase [Alkalihalobacillus alcalophilus]KGA96916.1 phosphoribosylaminoimidazole-succinocarboxamide synthase [Alkalihalobacillus alcalophilus ATCC 27647 = CGMCC 1.3604]MED1562268.1 phosphoribosylaminoimidazolesuccinocarboxamide synthase [Alkalihalobacillus alcalophilus]THG89415.1 phosphoribosylaminoimidazole-succinocarboxamide synthase [Alkalihalobacillus alcalophilus ATCC 27647 = CGMCC 1.3604]
MEKQQLLYEGKAKKIYQTNEANILWIEYKDEATAFNGEKKDTLAGKGRLNNEISSLIFTQLKDKGIESHFVERLSETEQLVQKVEIVPLEVVVRNIVAGSMAKRLGMEEGTPLSKPIVEFYYKDDDLGDPLITEAHIELLEAASDEEVAQLREMALAVNEHLLALFSEINIRLVDFKLEFGRTVNGELLLADEISPDTCRLWDKDTNERFDKDLFRRNLGNLQEGYAEILARLTQHS